MEGSMQQVPTVKKKKVPLECNQHSTPRILQRRALEHIFVEATRECPSLPMKNKSRETTRLKVQLGGLPIGVFPNRDV